MSGYMQSFPRPTKTYHTKTYDRIANRHGFQGQGKTVLITGGASGIGLSIGKAFARTGIRRLALVSRSADQQAEAKKEIETIDPSVQVLTYRASITDTIRMDEILAELGTLDVLILNAAVAHRRAKATDITVEEVREAFEINVVAAFNLVKAYMAMQPPESGQKTVINVSSGAAHMPGPFRVGYGTSKAAAAQVMQSFASQFTGGDVKIFSFHPGSHYTPGVAQNVPRDRFEWDDLELPSDFALWLAGPESRFLHGRHLWAHWDVDELLELKEKCTSDPSFLTIGLVQ